ILGKLESIQIAQCIIRESTAYRYEIVSYIQSGQPVILSLDVFSDIRYPGAVYMTAEDFLAARSRCKDLFWIPPAHVEFAYYLLKKLEKSSRIGPKEFDDAHGQR